MLRRTSRASIQGRGEPFVALAVHAGSNSPASQRAAEVELAVLNDFPNVPVVTSLSSSDVTTDEVNRMIAEFAESRGKVRVIGTIGNRRYLSLLPRAALIIGNSSSGVLEAPFFGVPTVNIGSRQHVRVRASSVADAGYSYEVARIESAKTLQREQVLRPLPVDLTFGDVHASNRIVRHLRNVMPPLDITKEFYDL